VILKAKTNVLFVEFFILFLSMHCLNEKLDVFPWKTLLSTQLQCIFLAKFDFFLILD